MAHDVAGDPMTGLRWTRKTTEKIRRQLRSVGIRVARTTRWGLKGFTTTIKEFDLRPGGRFKQVMHGPDGTDYPNLSLFREVVPHERIVYTHGGGKEGGVGAQFEATSTTTAPRR